MEEITIDNAPQVVRDTFNRGFSAMERGNLDHAIAMFITCVEIEPRFFMGRKFLRAAEVKKFKASPPNTVMRAASFIAHMPRYLKSQAMLQAGKPIEALKDAEKLLRKDPLSLTFLDLFNKAAEAADLPEVAIQTLVIAREHYPDNADLIERLGQLYRHMNQTKLAVECFEKLTKLRPTDGEALKKLKDAMAVHSMQGDGWAAAATRGESFRTLIKDEGQAEMLEKEAKAVKGEKDIEMLIQENQAKIQREPGNMNYRRALANLYTANGMFMQSLDTLKEAQRLSGGRDPQIDAAITAVTLRQYDATIEQLRENGDTAGAEKKALEKREYVFQDIQDRVQRYPNDLQLRYDYGVQLYEREQITEAIQQFQMAQKNAQRRVKSFFYIGMCFKKKQQFDLALSQLETAAQENPIMDESKKETLYEMGVMLESMGRVAEALEDYKRIYSTDISYRDIAERVDKSYKALKAAVGAPAAG